MQNRLMGSLRSRNISRIIMERIVEGIMSGDLQPGQRLPTEEEFATRIGAGKSSVREAIKILEAVGVLEIRRGDGTYVVDQFKGSMLDPVVYGILLSDRNEKDLADFLVRVQRMSADDLLEHDAGARCAEAAVAHASTADELENVELQLAGEVTNPLVGELYRRAIRIGAVLRQKHVEKLSEWMDRYLQALASNDALQVGALLDEELNLLTSDLG